MISLIFSNPARSVWSVPSISESVLDQVGVEKRVLTEFLYLIIGKSSENHIVTTKRRQIDIPEELPF